MVHNVWQRDYGYRGTAHLIMAGLTVSGWSEWSTLPQLPENPASVWVRVTREGKTMLVDYSLDGVEFSILKVCALPRAAAEYRTFRSKSNGGWLYGDVHFIQRHGVRRSWCRATRSTVWSR